MSSPLSSIFNKSPSSDLEDWVLDAPLQTSDPENPFDVLSYGPKVSIIRTERLSRDSSLKAPLSNQLAKKSPSLIFSSRESRSTSQATAPFFKTAPATPLTSRSAGVFQETPSFTSPNITTESMPSSLAPASLPPLPEVSEPPEAIALPPDAMDLSDSPVNLPEEESSPALNFSSRMKERIRKRKDPSENSIEGEITPASSSSQSEEIGQSVPVFSPFKRLRNHPLKTFKRANHSSSLFKNLRTFRWIRTPQNAPSSVKRKKVPSNPGLIERGSKFFLEILDQAPKNIQRIFEQYKSRLRMSLTDFQEEVAKRKQSKETELSASIAEQNAELRSDSSPISKDSPFFEKILAEACVGKMGAPTYRKYQDRLTMSESQFQRSVRAYREKTGVYSQQSTAASLITLDGADNGEKIEEGSELFNQLLDEASGYRMVTSVFRRNEHRLSMSRDTFRKRVVKRMEEKSVSSVPPSEAVDPTELGDSIDEAIQKNNVAAAYKQRKKDLGISFEVFRKKVWLEKVARNPSDSHKFPGFYFLEDEIESLPPSLKEEALAYREKHHQRAKEARAKKEHPNPKIERIRERENLLSEGRDSPHPSIYLLNNKKIINNNN